MASPNDGAPARNGSASLRRALEILDFLASPQMDGAGATLADVCEGAGVNKSTALRLLTTLAEWRLTRQDAESRRWSLGPHTAFLGQRYSEDLHLPTLARPTLKRLSHATGETAYLVVLEGTHACYVDKVEATDSSVRMVSRVGALQPTYSSGVGKCLLAHAGGDLFERVVGEGLAARTENTITDVDELRAELARIRARGYAIDDIENEAHVRCVAAPIFQADSSVCAALSVAGPTNRVTPERVPDLIGPVQAAAQEVTGLLAGRNPQHGAQEGDGGPSMASGERGAHG